MTWLVLIVLVAALVALIAKKRGKEQPVDPEAAVRAAIELHAIGRRLDIAQARHEQRLAALQLRREIAEALEEDNQP
jgi:uncharacterized protein YehS (DUF1456 family)